MEERKTIKINVLGTHGVGKSTLAFQIGTLLKKHDINVKIIAENIRACPFPINEVATVETELWVYHQAIVSELEAQAEQYQAVILDRGVLDGIVYFLDRNTPNEYYDLLCEMAYEWAQSEYDLFVLVEPDDPDEAFIVDKVRDSKIEYRKRIMLLFREFIKKLNAASLDKVIVVKSSEIFDENLIALKKIEKKLF